MSKITKTIAALGVVAGLGVAALPLASYAAVQNPSTVNLTASLDNSLSLSVTETELAFELENGGAVVTDETAATVTTNNGKGYDLNIKAASGDGALTSTVGSYTIPAGPAAQGTSAWGYNTNGGDTYTAVTATDVSIASSTAPTPTAGTTTNITIGVSADATQEAGTYKGSFVLTAANRA